MQAHAARGEQLRALSSTVLALPSVSTALGPGTTAPQRDVACCIKLVGSAYNKRRRQRRAQAQGRSQAGERRHHAAALYACDNSAHQRRAAQAPAQLLHHGVRRAGRKAWRKNPLTSAVGRSAADAVPARPNRRTAALPAVPFPAETRPHAPRRSLPAQNSRTQRGSAAICPARCRTAAAPPRAQTASRPPDQNFSHQTAAPHSAAPLPPRPAQ